MPSCDWHCRKAPRMSACLFFWWKRWHGGERRERGREDKCEWLGENWPLTLPDKEKKRKWWKNTKDKKLMPRRKNKGMGTIVLHMIVPCLYLQSLVEKENYRQSSQWFTSIPGSVTAVVGSGDTWNHRRQLEAEEGIFRHYLSVIIRKRKSFA